MQFSSCGVPYRSVNLKLKLKLFNIENVYYHSYFLNIYRQTERAYCYTARKAVPSIFMCHSFITNALHIGRKANWHKLQWCKQRHTTNSCVWSTNACTAILERQSKRNILYNCDTPAMQLALEDRRCKLQNIWGFPLIEKGLAVIKLIHEQWLIYSMLPVLHFLFKI